MGVASTDRRPTRTTSLHPEYRPDIDGLRAVAILSVVGYHAFPTIVPGGFTGVDVFFVISGYLISTIILQSVAAGTFSLPGFYARRVRRIFPALLLVLAAVFAVGWFTLLADEYAQLGRHIWTSATFITNFALRRESGYFENIAETKPLLHLWSLAIEEQFYLVWPLLLWAAARFRFGPLALIASALVVSFAWNVHDIAGQATRTFYWPHTRAWELLCGGLLAWTTVAIRPRASAAVSNGLSLVGVGLLAYGVLRLTALVPFPGAWASVPVVGACCLVAAGPTAWANRALSVKPLVWVGLISFPLYLWHWPLLSLARIIEGEPPANSVRAAVVAASFGLAWLTYVGLERPIRTGRSGWGIVTGLVGAMVVMGAVGYYTSASHGVPSRVREFAVVAAAVDEWDYPGRMTAFPVKGRKFMRQASANADITFFVGDSNVEQYYPRADALIQADPAHTRSVVFSTAGGCLAIPGSPHDDQHSGCRGLMEHALDYVRSESRVRTVVIAAQWNGYLADGRALQGTFGYGSENYRAAIARFGPYLRELRSLGRQVVVILNIPTGAGLDPRHMAKRTLANFPHVLSVRQGGIARAALEADYGAIQQDLRRAAEAAGAVVLSPLDFVCDAQWCPALDGTGTPMYKDASHLRPSYVKREARFLDQTLQDGQK